MSTIRFSDAVTALLAAFAAAAPLTGVTVADGPSPTAAADPDFIIVGHDGSLDADGALSGITQAGSLTQAWLEFRAVKEETGHVHCVAVSQTGDSTDLPGRRARARPWSPRARTPPWPPGSCPASSSRAPRTPRSPTGRPARASR